MKALALCLIVAAPAFSQQPAAPAPTPAQQVQQNPCQMLAPVEVIDSLTPSNLKLQIIYANECIIQLRAQQLGSEFSRAAEKAKQLEAEAKPVEPKKESAK